MKLNTHHLEKVSFPSEQYRSRQKFVQSLNMPKIDDIKDFFSSKPKELSEFCSHEKSYMFKNSSYDSKPSIEQRFIDLAGIK